MPKRTKTPPPPEDEPRYLVVVHPYPLNANLLLHADRRTLALWLACCTGKDALYAMYYKPASPGMVIIEVDRYFERFDSLLGMHDWSSFLKHPTEEDKGKTSKIFWCHYNSGRLVQKNGWKRVDVEENWFHGWSPSNNIIKHPYPKTKYCDVPAEAQTGLPLCRPLPRDTFTPPPPRPRPTVGSAEWIQSRSSNISSEAPSSSRRRRGDGSQIAPSDSASMISSAAMSDMGARAPRAPPIVSRWLADQRDKQIHWPSPPSTISSLSSSTASSSIGSRTPSALGAAPAAAPPPSRTSVPARPPGLSAQPVPSHRPDESFDWSADVDRHFEAQQGDAPTSPHSAGTSTTRAPGGHTGPPRRAPEAKGAIDPDQDYEYEEDDVPKRSTADAMKDMFDGAPRVAASVGNDAVLHDVEEEEEADYLEWNYPQAVRTTTENQWDGYGVPRSKTPSPTRVNIKGGEEWICPHHGPTCNPGICKTRADFELERRKQKEREDRQEARKKRLAKKNKDDEKRKRKLDGREVSHDLPHRFAGYRHTGAGGSGSESDSSDSTGSESHSPPPVSPQGSVAGAEGRAEEGSLWDDDNAHPKVSLPGSSGWSASGSNRVEGEDEARSVGIPRTAGSATNPNNTPASHQQFAQVARSAAAGTNASAPSARGDVTARNSAQASASGRQSGDARGSAASSWGEDPPATAQSPVPRPHQSVWGSRGAASPPTTTTSARGDGPTSSQWPAPGQSASNTRSTASAWSTSSSSSTCNDKSTGPYVNAAAAPLSRQGNGRQKDRDRSESTGASSSTLSDHRSSVSSEPRSPASMSRVPNLPPGISLSVDGGFPTYADTTWGDPIAAAQSASRSRKSKSTSGTSSAGSRSAVGADIADGQAGGDDGRDKVEAGQEQEPGRGRRGNRRGGRRGTARRTATATEPAAAPSTSQEAALPNVLDVSLPPGGPGAQWADENAEW